MLFLALVVVALSLGPSAGTTSPPSPPIWPLQFHAVLVQNRSGHLALTDLWYDFPGGRNANIIHRQLASTTFDIEWTNGTSFFFSDQGGGCKTVHFDVGILRPDWLSGAQYLGRRERDGFTCNVWTKAEFITYYADVTSGWPVFWKFERSGAEFHVLSFEEGAQLAEDRWQAPAACFEDKAASTRLGLDKGPEFVAMGVKELGQM